MERQLYRAIIPGQKIYVLELVAEHLKLLTQPKGEPRKHHFFFCFKDLTSKEPFYHTDLNPEDWSDISKLPIDALEEKAGFLAFLLNGKCKHSKEGPKSAFPETKLMDKKKLLALEHLSPDNLQIIAENRYYLHISAKYDT
jgi:hypothetical protein